MRIFQYFNNFFENLIGQMLKNINYPQKLAQNLTRICSPLYYRSVDFGQRFFDLLKCPITLVRAMPIPERLLFFNSPSLVGSPKGETLISELRLQRLKGTATRVAVVIRDTPKGVDR